MDISTIAGLLAGFALIVVSILQGGDLGAFISVSSMIIVFGGSVCAAFINFPLDEIGTIPGVIKVAMLGKVPKLETIIAQIVKLAETARRDGILAMEGELENVDDDYLKKGLQLVIDGTREESLSAIMDTEMSNVEARHKVGVDILMAMAGYAPAFGMIGTLIGLIQMLRALDDPSQIGVGMAVALITTFYGSILANMLFVPLAGKLKRKSQQEMVIKEMVLTGVMAILNGENPRMINDTLLAYIKPKNRAKQEARK
ncbi:motility protein A [candidate division KSB1 bacterium]|nr:motility protein A [candidate division KSB1 bacterium]